MSNAGPVFPLTLAQAEPALFADRELLLDCAPYAEENTAAITVTDRYTIRNDSGENCTVTALYPFVSSLSDLNLLQPVLTTDGVAVKSTLYPGCVPRLVWSGQSRTGERGGTLEYPPRGKLDRVSDAVDRLLSG